MKNLAFVILAMGTLSASAAIIDGTPLVVAEGTTESVAAGQTQIIPYFYNYGTLTVGAGATLKVQGAANTSFGALGEGGTCTINLEQNANLTISSASNAFNKTAFSAAYLGATGIVNIASGATLDVQGHCRFATNDDSAEARRKKTFVELNVSGTLKTLAPEMTPFFPTAATAPDIAASTNNYPHGFVANLNEGGIWLTGNLVANDCAYARVNFNGGTLQFKETRVIPYNGAAIVEYIATAGHAIIIDTQGYTIGFQNAQGLQFHGPGGLVKRGTGTLNLLSSAQYSDFSGPIVVEAGTLFLARPLLPGQTVTVKSGAKFVPASSADLAFVTYEDPADQPAPNALYTINGNVTGGVDLLGLAPAYDTERLGGPTVGVSATLAGTVTHAPATSEDPFTLVGQHKDAKLTLDGTGLNTVPLLVNGPGTFLFAGDRTFTVGDGMVALANGGVYGQTGALTIRDPNALDYTLEDGGLSGSSIYLGRNGDNVNLTVATNGTLVTAGRVYLATNLSGEDRQHFGQSHLVVNGTVNAAELRFGANSTTSGVTEATSRASVTVNAGGTAKGSIVVNDDCYGRLVLNGGTFTATMGSGTGAVFAPSQAGSRFDVEVTGANGTLDFANTTNNLCGSVKPTTILGDGTLNVVGNAGVLTWGPAGKLVANWSGDTVFNGGTVKLNGASFPSGSGKGAVRLGGGTLDLNGSTMVVNAFTQEGGTVVNSSSKQVLVTVGVDGRDIVNNVVYPAKTVLTKTGAGAMSSIKKLPEAFILEGGTFAITPVAYEHYRFKVEKAYGPKCNSMQIGEFKLINDCVDVTRPYASVGRASMGTASPANEPPAKAVDGLLNTKFLDFNAAFNSSYRDYCWLQLDYEKPLAVTHYTWATANDCYNPYSTDGLCRNPTDWRLQGSHDGVTWVDLDHQTGIMVSVGSNSWCGTEFSAGIGGAALADTAVSVKSGAKIDVMGGVAAVGSLTMQGGSIDLHDATLQLNGSGVAVGGGITGTGSIEKTGAGTFGIGGTNTFSGDVVVRGGTLRIDTSAKWFRLTIKQTGPADSVMQLSEFGLFDADGNRVNLGLTAAANGTAAALLQPGTFAKAEDYACGGAVGKKEDAHNLFDGNTSTKWCATAINMSASQNDPSKWRVVTMRLADDAAPVVGCNICTANDSPNRSPRIWTVEASYDGVSWFTAGDYSVTPTGAYFTWYSATPYAFTTPASSTDSPFPTGTPVEICTGATLDCGGISNVVSALRLDATTGGGTITNFAPTANGTLSITNATDFAARQLLDLTVTGPTLNVENLKTWSVYVNGKLRGGYPGIDPVTGKLFIKSLGAVIYLR